MDDDANVRIAKVLGFGIHDVSYWAKYDEDLNLMHILEEWLQQDECDWEEYIEALEAVIGVPSRGRLVHATAAQKAEAWLKVKER